MQVVCEATQSSDTKVRVAALQCLVKIMSLYYQYMEYYMGPALFAVSTKGYHVTFISCLYRTVDPWSNNQISGRAHLYTSTAVKSFF